MWTPDPRHRHHQPNTTQLDHTPPKEALHVARDLSHWDFPSVDQVLWVGKGAVGRVGWWKGGCPQPIEVSKQCMLFFVGSVHQLEVCKGDNVDADSEIDFAMSGVAPPGWLTTLWHLANTAPAWRLPRCSKAGAWSITYPCDCKVCLLVCLLCLLANWTKFT